MTEHYDAESLYRRIEGALDPAEARAVESHLRGCEACRALSEECEATLSALDGWARHAPAPPAGWWDAFWARWPLAGDVRAQRRASRGPRWAAAAAVLVLAAGVWWAAGPRGPEAPGVAVRTGPAEVAAPAPGRAMAGTPWEADMAEIQRLAVAVGSVDPLSKGVLLASLSEKP